MDKAVNYSKAFLASLPGGQGSVKNFLALLRKHGDLYLLPRILRHLEQTLSQKGETVITSRFPLDEKTKQEIFDFLKSKWSDVKEKDIVYKTNPELLGGVSIRHKDFLFDATLDSALQNLKHTLA